MKGKRKGKKRRTSFRISGPELFHGPTSWKRARKKEGKKGGKGGGGEKKELVPFLFYNSHSA